jgi:hypothetical protein
MDVLMVSAHVLSLHCGVQLEYECKIGLLTVHNSFVLPLSKKIIYFYSEIRNSGIFMFCVCHLPAIKDLITQFWEKAIAACKMKLLDYLSFVVI